VDELHRARHSFADLSNAETHRPFERLATIGGWEVMQDANRYRQTVNAGQSAGAT
jgi:hypothetical protein